METPNQSASVGAPSESVHRSPPFFDIHTPPFLTTAAMTTPSLCTATDRQERAPPLCETANHVSGAGVEEQCAPKRSPERTKRKRKRRKRRRLLLRGIEFIKNILNRLPARRDFFPNRTTRAKRVYINNKYIARACCCCARRETQKLSVYSPLSFLSSRSRSLSRSLSVCVSCYVDLSNVWNYLEKKLG